MDNVRFALKKNNNISLKLFVNIKYVKIALQRWLKKMKLNNVHYVRKRVGIKYYQIILLVIE